jgi:hypothetical protein
MRTIYLSEGGKSIKNAIQKRHPHLTGTELFVLEQSESKSPLGRACKKALELGLVDNDSDENGAAMDPAISWLNDKDGDIVGNQRRWRALLRDLPSALPELPLNARLKRAKRPIDRPGARAVSAIGTQDAASRFVG